MSPSRLSVQLPALHALTLHCLSPLPASFRPCSSTFSNRLRPSRRRPSCSRARLGAGRLPHLFRQLVHVRSDPLARPIRARTLTLSSRSARSTGTCAQFRLYGDGLSAPFTMTTSQGPCTVSAGAQLSCAAGNIGSSFTLVRRPFLFLSLSLRPSAALTSSPRTGCR